MRTILKNKIIRKQTKDGALIGPHLRVIKVEREGVYGVISEKDKDSYLIMRPNVHICSMIDLSISKSILERIIRNKQTCLSHPYHSTSKKWVRLYKERPELVKLYSSDGFVQAIYVVDDVYLTTLAGQRCIMLSLGKKLPL